MFDKMNFTLRALVAFFLLNLIVAVEANAQSESQAELLRMKQSSIDDDLFARMAIARSSNAAEASAIAQQLARMKRLNEFDARSFEKAVIAESDKYKGEVIIEFSEFPTRIGQYDFQKQMFPLSLPYFAIVSQTDLTDWKLALTEKPLYWMALDETWSDHDFMFIKRPLRKRFQFSCPMPESVAAELAKIDIQPDFRTVYVTAKFKLTNVHFNGANNLALHMKPVELLIRKGLNSSVNCLQDSTRATSKPPVQKQAQNSGPSLARGSVRTIVAEVNVRSEPRMQGPILTTLKPGTVVTVDNLPENNGWSRISVKGGPNGWSLSNTLLKNSR